MANSATGSGSPGQQVTSTVEDKEECDRLDIGEDTRDEDTGEEGDDTEDGDERDDGDEGKGLEDGTADEGDGRAEDGAADDGAADGLRKDDASTDARLDASPELAGGLLTADRGEGEADKREDGPAELTGDAREDGRLDGLTGELSAELGLEEAPAIEADRREDTGDLLTGEEGRGDDGSADEGATEMRLDAAGEPDTPDKLSGDMLEKPTPPTQQASPTK